LLNHPSRNLLRTVPGPGRVLLLLQSTNPRTVQRYHRKANRRFPSHRQSRHRPHPKTRCPARHLTTRRRKARASTRIELSLDAKRRTSLKYRTGDRRVGGYRDTCRSHPLLSLRTWRRNLPVHERGKPRGESCLLPARCRGALEPTVLASQLRRNLWRSRSIHWRARFDADSDHTDGECTWVRFVLGDRRRCRPLRPVPRLWWRRRRETKLCASPAISCE
jgi:hypothetical protein